MSPLAALPSGQEAKHRGHYGALGAATGAGKATGYLAKAAFTARSMLVLSWSRSFCVTLSVTTPSQTNCLRAASTTSMFKVPSVYWVTVSCAAYQGRAVHMPAR